jgi:hypothetical protein
MAYTGTILDGVIPLEDIPNVLALQAMGLRAWVFDGGGGLKIAQIS